MGLSAFLAKNAERPRPVRWAASPRFCGEDGAPELWELRCLSAEEDESLRRSCAHCVPLPGRRGQFMTETDAGMVIEGTFSASFDRGQMTYTDGEFRVLSDW